MSTKEGQRIYLDSSDTITLYENNLVDLKTSDGQFFEKLEPRRLFPVSKASEYITLLDTEGKEIAIIRNLKDISKDSCDVIAYSLNDYYLVPHITRIISTTEKYGTLHWCVDTDRGIKYFDIRNRNHDIKVYSDGRVRIRDSDDNRYVITDYRKLDGHSKKQLMPDL